MTRIAGYLLALGTASVALQPLAAQQMATEEVSASPAPTNLAPLYRPQDELERGLWMQVDEYERDLKVSKQVIHDEALNTYVREVLCKTVGEGECRNVRLYIMRTPYFNASMAPNGTMQVWSGLLLRMQNEAQLAAVLGHEYQHFMGRHSVKLFREAKEKSNTATWLAFTGIGAIFAIGMVGSVFEFSREMEREADLGGIDMIARAGYDTREAAVVWEQLLDERDATLVARGQKAKKRKTKASMFESHPPSQERIEYLRVAAARSPGLAGAVGSEAYQTAMRQWWPVFLDDQLKMNDFGASAFLLDSMRKASGPTPWLDFAYGELYRSRGQGDDFEKALGFYTQAIDRGGDLPELWRGRGLALRKLGRAEEGEGDLREYLVRAPDAADHSMISMLAGGIR